MFDGWTFPLLHPGMRKGTLRIRPCSRQGHNEAARAANAAVDVFDEPDSGEWV